MWQSPCDPTLPPGDASAILLALVKAQRMQEELWSDVVVIPHKTSISEKDIDSVRANFSTGNDTVIGPKLFFDALGAFQSVNAFTMGYYNATGKFYGGAALQLLSHAGDANHLTGALVLIGIPLDHWTDDTIGQIFDTKFPKGFGVGWGLAEELTDLSSDEVSGIPAAIEQLNRFHFYELVFEAHCKWHSGDYIGGLLLAVAALEGIHAIVVSMALESKLPKERTGKDKDLEEDFLKELGFSLCNKLTPYVLMDEPNRPTDELIKRTAKAVTYRNEIMHALRNASGQYKIRFRSIEELGDAFNAAMEMYEVYLKTVESLSSNPGDTSTVDE